MSKRRWTLLIDDALDATRFLTSPHVTIENVEDIPDPPRRQTFEITTSPGDNPFTAQQVDNALRSTWRKGIDVREVTQ